jgi:diguanylate cyclase (GGDEF)-like protein/PAS domain S-box-containing protein
MKAAKLPKNEIERLIALKQYQILDTASEQSFDDITRLASMICGTPIALITLLDENRQWFKSAVGLDAAETPRNISFCGHAILGDDIFEISNALEDERFFDNPLVRGQPNIRFYAGMPLITENGYALGSLCVIDQTARELSAEQRDALKILGRQVVAQIEHRMTTLKIEEMTELLENTGSMAKVGGWILDLWSMQIQWTKEVFAIHELDATEPPSVEEAIRYYAPEYQPMIMAAVKRAIATGESWDLELPFITAKDNHLWVRVQGTAIYKNGKVVRLMGSFQNITELKKSQFDLAWVNRALLILSKSNETLIHMNDETKLIKEICRIIVDIGDYRMAWVGYAEDDDDKSIKAKAYYGHNDSNFLDKINLSWSDEHASGLGPGGKTIRGGLPIVVGDLMLDPTYPAKEAAYEQGYMSLISLPLKAKDKVFGLLAMYASETRGFAAQEVSLLQELADNLAAGIINIRLEKERQLLNLAMLKLAKSVNVASGDGFFEQLMASMVETSGAQAGYIARLLPEKPLKGRMLAAMVDGNKIDNFDYAIPDVIVQALFSTSDLYIAAHNAYIDFPLISMMRFHKYQAFAALRLHDANREDVGLLFVFFHQPIHEHSLDLIRSTLKIFAARAASELERVEANNRIHEQASLLDKTHDAIVVRDMSDRVTFWNKGAEKLYGWTSLEAIHQPIQQLLKLDLTVFNNASKKLMEHDEWTGEITEYHKDGSMLIIESHWTLVRDHEGRPKSIFAVKSDITTRKQAENKILEMAFYDSLTKLPNRRLLVDRLEKALVSSVRSKSYGALLFIDLDNFKILNDTLGHDKGDMLLQEVATRLNVCVREEDTVARLGGDEFVIMIENLDTDIDQASAFAGMIGNKILNELNHTFDFDGYQHSSTPSIGIAMFNNQTKSVNELIKQADTAMYQSKAAGRNRLTFYSRTNFQP